MLEVLTVVGITGLLLAILIPAYSRARGAQNSVSCLSNLRQITIGCKLYIGENRTFPNPGVTGTPWEQSISEYLDTNEVFHCPADKELFNTVESSYDWRDTGNNLTSFAGRSPSEVRGPSRVLCFDALPGWHRRDSINVGFHDGSAQAMDLTEYWRDMDRSIYDEP